MVAHATQGLLYERMTGDTRYGPMVAAHRDWLLGRIPWGVSMFTGLPEGGRFSAQPHLSTTHLTKRSVRGGLVDEPVKAAIFRALRGVALSGADACADCQAEQAVYHDDVMDYATNEPTMDGTASAVLTLALLAAGEQR